MKVTKRGMVMKSPIFLHPEANVFSCLQNSINNFTHRLQ
jgi:hypothetical protein